MCGIVGAVTLKGQRVDVRDIKLMASTLVHRGPDEAGLALLNHGTVGFGHLRLSIIDLVSGQQPLHNEDGSVALVFNGEIYDYKPLRRQLEALGYTFHTTSDSEVLLRLYEHYGLDFFEHLNGEFAFLIWDQHRRRLLAARDRMGVKPLFYRHAAGEVLFASEAKAILALPRVERQLSSQYLTGPLFGVIPPDNCPFEGVKSLAPGHMLLIEDGQVRDPRPYWQMAFNIDESLSLADAEERVRHLLKQAVKRRVVADVEVGVYLSGGLDSTAVTGLMREDNPSIKAFNIGFGGSAYDESDLSRRIAGHYGVDFVSLDCSMEAMSEHYFETIFHTELALANPSAIAKKMLSRTVREHGVKVCLTGEGADEAFGGYPFFKLEAIWHLLASSSPADRKRAKALMARFEKTDYRSRGVLWDNDIPWKRTPWFLGYPSYHQMRALYSRKYMPLLFNHNQGRFDAEDSPDRVFAKHFVRDDVRLLAPFNATRVISFGQLSGYIIPTLGDRVEMANSVECRTPFLDRDLIEFVATVPPEHFIDIDRLREKNLLRRAVDSLLPPFVKNEHKHPFFSNNWHAFSKTRRGREIVGELISSRNLKRTGIFNTRFVKPIMSGWKIAPEGSKYFKRVDCFLGLILGTQALQQLFIDSRPAASDSFAMVDRTRRAGAAGEKRQPAAPRSRRSPSVDIAPAVTVESRLKV